MHAPLIGGALGDSLGASHEELLRMRRHWVLQGKEGAVTLSGSLDVDEQARLLDRLLRKGAVVTIEAGARLAFEGYVSAVYDA